MAGPRHPCFAVCTPGLEPILAGELAALGIRSPRPGRGGVEFTATTRQLYAANHWLRTATRVLVRIGGFSARSFPELVAAADELPWHLWLPAGMPVRFRISSSGSRLFHTGAIEERLRSVLAVPRVPRDDEPAQLVVVRVQRDTVTVSVDASGEPLYKRGWRQDTAKAPLRETLAAALLLAAGWDGSVPLVDPFCGSGTIPIEAALLARNAAPGHHRSFAFRDWPSFEPGTWASVAEDARRAERPGPVVAIAGSDRDAGAVDAAQANAERAGVAGDVTFRHAAISDLEPPPGDDGWLVSNPPYGGRISGSGDLRDLYARLGDVVRARIPGWQIGLLVADTRLAAQTRLGLQETLRTTTGGIDVRFVTTRPPG